MKGKRLPLSINYQLGDLEFNTIDWFDDDYIIEGDTKDEDGKYIPFYNRQHNKFYTIFGFGITETGYSVCCRINEYLPYFYILIPQDLNDKQIKDFKIAFDSENVAAVPEGNLNNEEKFYSPYMKNSIVGIEEVEREILWKFMNKQKFRFLKISFRSHFALKFYFRALSEPINLDIRGSYRGRQKYNLFEADLEPLLRFYHDTLVKPSGWIKVLDNTYKKVMDQSHCQINISVDVKNVIVSDNTGISPLRVASFDIEADSSHGDFPIAYKDCKKLSNQLVITWLRDRTIMEKESKETDKYKNAEERIKLGSKFFADRIKQSLQISKYRKVDDDVDILYCKGCHNSRFEDNMIRKCHGFDFDELCENIFKICNHDVKKVNANQKMKMGMNEVASRDENHLLKYGTMNFQQYCDIVEDVAKKETYEIESVELFKDKMLTKDIMVRFVNELVNSFIGKVYGDRVIQIGTVFWEYGNDSPFHNNIITLKNCDDFKVRDDNCEIVSFDYLSEHDADRAEAKILQAWTKLIIEYDPDIIVGYNIHGFDMSFMYDRALDIIANADKNASDKELEKKLKGIHAKKYNNFMSMGRLHQNIVEHCSKAKGKLINKKLSSSALGDNFLFYFNIPGRVQIDLMKVCQSSMTKLPSYKLDDVASFYISGKIKGFKDDNVYPEGNKTRKIKVSNMKEIDDGNFIVVTMMTTGQQLYDGGKLVINNIDRDNDILELEKPVPTDCLPMYPQWGLAKDDVSPKDIFRLQKGTNADRMIVAKYCIQDCVLLIRLLKKLEVIPNNIGMSNVSLIPFSYIFLRGQGIKIFSLVVNECAENSFVLPTLDKIEVDEEEVELQTIDRQNMISEVNFNNFRGYNLEDVEEGYKGRGQKGGAKRKTLLGHNQDNNDVFQLRSDFNVIKMTEDSFEGAIVLVPKPNIYFEPVTVLDFSSLYPSEMIAGDLSHDRIVEDECWLGEEGEKRLNALGYDVLDRSYDNLVWVDSKNKNKGKRKQGIKTVRFVQTRDGEKGLIPKILMKLLGARKATKKRMKAEKDPFKYTILDGLQLAYKLTANSLYGQIGARTSKIFKKEIAASTTAGGRINIYKAKDFCLKNNPGCDVVYGDSIPGWEFVNLFARKKGVPTHPLIHIFDKISVIKHNYFIWNNNDINDNSKHHLLPHPDYDIFTMTDKGETRVLNLMEHKSKNDIIKIVTLSGTVHVTDEHSIILENGEVVTPRNIKIGDTLLSHSNNNYPYSYINNEEGLTRAKVINIVNIGPTQDNVYDLTTENHHYQAGYGNIVIHNTDSVFVKFNLDYNLEPNPDICPDLFNRFKTPYLPPNREGVFDKGKSYPETKLDKIVRSMEIGFWIQEKLKEDNIYTSPHDLEYEKVYYPLILITKKRYIGIKYEFDPEEGEKTSMGVVTKRRDNAPILKHTFIGVVDTLMKDCDLYKAIDLVKDICKKMIYGYFDLNMFVISKTLREYYKDPESIAHKVLAMRMGERDPGNKPSSNERIPYVYIKIEEKTGVKYIQGDRIEHVDYVRETNCQVDYEVYITNQIMKPVSQIFELVVEHIPGYKYHKHPEYFNNLEQYYYQKYNGDLKKTQKKISQLKINMIKELIFEPLIQEAIIKFKKINTLDKYIQISKKDDIVLNIDIRKFNNYNKEKPKLKLFKEKKLNTFFTKVEPKIVKSDTNTVNNTTTSGKKRDTIKNYKTNGVNTKLDNKVKKTMDTTHPDKKQKGVSQKEVKKSKIGTLDGFFNK